MSKFRHTKPAPDPAAVAAFAAGADTRSTVASPSPREEAEAEGIKRVTLRLDKPRWRRVRAHCYQHEVTVQQFLIDAVDAALGAAAKQ